MVMKLNTLLGGLLSINLFLSGSITAGSSEFQIEQAAIRNTTKNIKIDESTAPTPSGTIAFRDAQHGFTLQIPDTWEMKEGFSEASLDFVLIATSPMQGEKDPFIENMNVLVEDIKNEKMYNLENYLLWNLVGLMEELPKFVLQDKADVEINGIKMARLTYQWEMNGVKTITYQYIFTHLKKGYVMTFSAQPEEFKANQPVFDQIAKSMKFE
jgi:hypothetical protein